MKDRSRMLALELGETGFKSSVLPKTWGLERELPFPIGLINH